MKATSCGKDKAAGTIKKTEGKCLPFFYLNPNVRPESFLEI